MERRACRRDPQFIEKPLPGHQHGLEIEKLERRCLTLLCKVVMIRCNGARRRPLSITCSIMSRYMMSTLRLLVHEEAMEIVELSGRTTGRLGYTWPTTSYAIGGTATLALRYSIISTTAAARTRPQ